MEETFLNPIFETPLAPNAADSVPIIMASCEELHWSAAAETVGVAVGDGRTCALLPQPVSESARRRTNEEINIRFNENSCP